MDRQTGALRPLALDETPKGSEIPVTAEEAEVLAHYDARYRPELIRRWRAGILVVRDGMLRDANPGARDHARRLVAGALERAERTKKRRREGAAARAKNRKKRR